MENLEDLDPCDDEIDWLTGKYTYKKDRLRREIERLEGRWDNF
jgi:hypothetical protein